MSSQQGIHGIEHRHGGGIWGGTWGGTHPHSAALFHQTAQSDQLEAVLRQGGGDGFKGVTPAGRTQIHQGGTAHLQLLMLQQMHQLFAPLPLLGELQQSAAGGAADQGALMSHKRLDHRQHLRLRHTDFTEGLKQRFTGFLQPGRAGLLGTGHRRAAGQAPPQRLHGCSGTQITKGAGRCFPQPMVLIFEGGQQVGDGGLGGRPKLAEGTGSIAGYGVFLNTGAGITRAPLAQGLLQQRHRIGVTAAVATQPPGGVVLS